MTDEPPTILTIGVVTQLNDHPPTRQHHHTTGFHTPPPTIRYWNAGSPVYHTDPNCHYINPPSQGNPHRSDHHQLPTNLRRCQACKED